jgi:hypothetical protein
MPGLGADGVGGILPNGTGGIPGPGLTTGGTDGLKLPAAGGVALKVPKLLGTFEGAAPKPFELLGDSDELKPFGLVGGSGVLKLLDTGGGVDGLRLPPLPVAPVEDAGKPLTLPPTPEKFDVPEVIGLAAMPFGDAHPLGGALLAPFNPAPVVSLAGSGSGILVEPLFCRGGSWHPHRSIPARNTLPTLSQGLEPICFLLILEF